MSRRTKTARGSGAKRGKGSLFLVTGGAGFIGSALADRLAETGQRVRVLDALVRPGVAANLDWLLARHPGRIEPIVARVEDTAAVDQAVAGVDGTFHLAAQVAVTSSLAEPLADLETNVRGTLNVLEACRRHGGVPLVFASTNKVYGDLGGLELGAETGRWLPHSSRLVRDGLDETLPLAFRTPYGCSKGAADQYVLDYALSFSVPTAVLRMSCIYGPRQLGTEDQGWVAHFILKALAGETITIYGDGRQVRDVLHVDDAVAAYIAACGSIEEIAGRAFNLGGGPANAISLLDLIEAIEVELGRRVSLRFADWRAGDQRYYVCDARRVRHALALPPAKPWRASIAELIAALRARTREATPVVSDRRTDLLLAEGPAP